MGCNGSKASQPDTAKASKLDTADSVGVWEYMGDDGSFTPFAPDESKKLDAAREGASEFTMCVDSGKLHVRINFSKNPDGGPFKQGVQRSLTTNRDRKIRRQAPAKELVQNSRNLIKQCTLDRLDVDVGTPKYARPESILSILDRETEPVKLIRGSWVTEYAINEGQKKGLPRRQELEQTPATQAFLPRSEVHCRTIADDRCLNVASISYCWRAQTHPDVDGHQLRVIEPEIKQLMCHKIFSGLFKDVGIFWDFCSLHQKDQHGERTKEEWKQFNEALNDMSIWYLHMLIMTFIVNVKVPLEPDVDYESRGWTHFERSCAELIKPAFAGRGDNVNSWPMIKEFKTSSRKVPLPPEEFAEQLAPRRFASRGDKETVVELYTKSCMHALQGVPVMDFEGVKVQRNDGPQLVKVLKHCCSLSKLRLTDMGIDDDEVKTIAAVLPNMPSLRELWLKKNNIADAGASAIANALPKMLALQELFLCENRIGDSGATAIANVLPRMHSLRDLILGHNAIGNAAAIAIANVLPHIASLQSLDLHANTVGDSGAIAIADALPKTPREFVVLYINDNVLSQTGKDLLTRAWTNTGRMMLASREELRL